MDEDHCIQILSQNAFLLLFNYPYCFLGAWLELCIDYLKKTLVYRARTTCLLLFQNGLL